MYKFLKWTFFFFAGVFGVRSIYAWDLTSMAYLLLMFVCGGIANEFKKRELNNDTQQLNLKEETKQKVAQDRK